LVVKAGALSDSVSYEDFIRSGMPPVADFEAENTEVVAGGYTNFINLSTGMEMDFKWIFEGGTPESSTEENPQQIYYLADTDSYYDVILIVTNVFGNDTLLKEDYIHTLSTSVGENDYLSIINLFPNPSKGIINISGVMNTDYNISIYDINGKRIIYKTVKSNDIMNLSGYDKGLYLIKIKDTKHNIVVNKMLILY
jgi:hypothetical protein